MHSWPCLQITKPQLSPQPHVSYFKRLLTDARCILLNQRLFWYCSTGSVRRGEGLLFWHEHRELERHSAEGMQRTGEKICVPFLPFISSSSVVLQLSVEPWRQKQTKNIQDKQNMRREGKVMNSIRLWSLKSVSELGVGIFNSVLLNQRMILDTSQFFSNSAGPLILCKIN